MKKLILICYISTLPLMLSASRVERIIRQAITDQSTMISAVKLGSKSTLTVEEFNTWLKTHGVESSNVGWFVKADVPAYVLGLVNAKLGRHWFFGMEHDVVQEFYFVKPENYANYKRIQDQNAYAQAQHEFNVKLGTAVIGLSFGAMVYYGAKAVGKGIAKSLENVDFNANTTDNSATSAEKLAQQNEVNNPSAQNDDIKVEAVIIRSGICLYDDAVESYEYEVYVNGSKKFNNQTISRDKFGRWHSGCAGAILSLELNRSSGLDRDAAIRLRCKEEYEVKLENVIIKFN
ncbi:MAG: hypothetical protein RL660_2403 [Bacteroidota bacterium]|jgi:hypothetical protein